MLRRRRIALGGAAVLLAAAGIGLIVIGSSTRSGAHALPPTPAAPGTSGASVASGPVRPSSPAGGSGVTDPIDPGGVSPLSVARKCAPARSTGAAVPVRICIPAIGVDASVISLGLNADHTVQVPPLSEVGKAGWYRYSPIPGAIGPTVILGHIDSARLGPGVFFELGRLRKGDLVDIARADHAVAEFRIERVAQYPKTRFPTKAVYGDTPNATVRLITCGGRFDAATGNYLDNIVAYGSLVALLRS